MLQGWLVKIMDTIIMDDVTTQPCICSGFPLSQCLITKNPRVPQNSELICYSTATSQWSIAQGFMNKSRVDITWTNDVFLLREWFLFVGGAGSRVIEVCWFSMVVDVVVDCWSLLMIVAWLLVVLDPCTKHYSFFRLISNIWGFPQMGVPLNHLFQWDLPL